MNNFTKEDLDNWILTIKSIIHGKKNSTEIFLLNWKELLMLLLELQECKEKSNNKMEKIGKMFNKKIGEDFKIQTKNGIRIARFGEGTFFVLEKTNKGIIWNKNADILMELISGEARIIEKE